MTDETARPLVRSANEWNERTVNIFSQPY